MFRLLIVVFSLYSISLFSGCATVVHGTTQAVDISSTPTGADVYDGGVLKCQTPCTTKLKRKKDHIIVLKKNNYQDATTTIMHTLSGAVAGNIIAGGLIGWGVDAIDGAQYKLVPETVNLTLTEISENSDSAEQAKPTVLSYDQRLKNLQDIFSEGGLSQEEYNNLRNKTILTASQGKVPNKEVIPADIRIENIFNLYKEKSITKDEYEATKLAILKEKM